MKLIKWIVVLILIIILSGAFWYFSLTSSFDKKILSDQDVFFTVEQGTTITEVAHNLKEQGVIRKAEHLTWLARIDGDDTVLAADYLFPTSFTLRDIYNAIRTGESLSDERQVTIIEGLTLDEIGEIYARKGLVDSADTFIFAVSNGLDRFTEKYGFLASKPDDANLEGYLFPDTYRYFEDATIDELIAKLLNTFETKLTQEMLDKIQQSGRGVHEVITLASIIEREVADPDDMQTVAGIFKNRLDIGMALQADSTINYVTKSGRARSTAEDLEVDSPYNTYKYPGLPPGPISNPGLNAIRAAIEPTDTDYMYFLTDKVGKVYYAETFNGHQQNRLFLENEEAEPEEPAVEPEPEEYSGE